MKITVTDEMEIILHEGSIVYFKLIYQNLQTGPRKTSNILNQDSCLWDDNRTWNISQIIDRSIDSYKGDGRICHVLFLVNCSQAG
jgi:hypothetical protein